MPFLADPLYLNLIRHIPVAQHSVPVRADLWQEPCVDAGLHELHQTLFAGAPQIRITREWLHHAVVSDELRTLAIILWGYPNGARASRHLHWLAQLPAVARAAAAPLNGWGAYRSGFAAIGGLGISTISKFACFFNRRFLPAGSDSMLPALILDRRILAVLGDKRWAELHPLATLTYPNAAARYLEYLRCLHDFAAKTGVQAEQLEFFLFAHGDAF